MTHVFVAPHPDDVALSCGGLVASLVDAGESVTIVTVFSGAGAAAGLTPYQREALGFGPREDGPTHDDPPAGRPGLSDPPSQGAVLAMGRAEAKTAGALMAARRLEDERYASFAGATVVFLDLPDAVFRGYEGDEQLLAAPRADDRAPIDLLLAEIGRLEPQGVYLPLGVGDHVDHQLVRRVGVALLAPGRHGATLGRHGATPGRRNAGIVAFYEDFPYAWWNDFRSLDDLPAGAFDRLPADVGLAPDYADITGTVERKIAGLTLYESQLGRLFGGADRMGDAVRGFGAKVASLGGLPGFAERYWATSRP